MPGKPGFERLFEPLRIRQMSLKNRLVMPPMTTNLCDEDGFATDRLKDYYQARADGGVGLVIVEATCVEAPRGKISAREPLIDDDRYLPGLRELARVIQQHGARAAIQLHHGGRHTSSLVTGHQPVAPSPIPSLGHEVPRELTVGEIKEIVCRFAEAAARAKSAGFDAVEIHAASVDLICQFLSAASNKRQDEYGGVLTNRARFLLETLRAVRRVVGVDYPVWCRLNAVEYGIEGGVTLEETRQVARLAEEAGADAIHVTAWGTTDTPLRVLSRPSEPGSQVPLAEAVKKLLSIPVIAVGRIDLELGERLLREGKADLVAIGRSLVADPQYINKATSERPEDITPCIVCNVCSNVGRGEVILCSVNAALGKERAYRIKPAEKRRKVLVVGGGPAGMEAARVAALRGHQVTLYEKEPRLGGQLIQASLPPHKDSIEALTGYLATQVRKLGVVVNLGKEADPAVVDQVRPEVVILATGVAPFVPGIPGIDTANVVPAERVLTGKVEVGERVIIMGGEMVGCETADFLAEKGKKVTVTRRGLTMAEKVGADRPLVLDRLAKKGVTTLTGVKYEEITGEGLTIIDKGGARQTIGADNIVLATGARPSTELFKALDGKVPEIHLAGDCVQPRRILEAISDGSRIARTI